MNGENKTKWYLVSIILVISFVGWVMKYQFSPLSVKNNHKPATLTLQPNLQSEEWITVFVHGTFSCLLGLFSFPAVLKDKVGSTLYKELVNAQRKDPANFLDQPMLQRGLIKIQPSYSLDATKGQRFLAYPLAQAFQDFSHYSNNNNRNTFYTFGWSGLLSQKRRRLEAVRFYNELSDEIQRYHQAGRNHKIRLIAHSHGGNLCLNLAAVNDVMTLYSYQDIAYETSDKATNKALAAMFDYIKNLPSKEKTANAKRHKQLDHMPTTGMSIDELILLGTPVQVETEPLFFSPTFKKIYHFYADSDTVQPLDHISSKKVSLRRIKYHTDRLPKIRAFPTLIQSKIIINCNNKQYPLTHKDLWGVSWHKNNNPLSPLPVSVLTPLLIEALNAQPILYHETDIDIQLTNEYVKIQTLEHGSKKIASTIQIKRNKFEEIKMNIKRWSPHHPEKA